MRDCSYETLKDVHLKLNKDTHDRLKLFLFKKRLSIQEVMEEFTRLVVSQDPHAMRVLDDLLFKKSETGWRSDKNRTRIAELGQETLYSLLEEQSPLTNRENQEDE